jgi:hypothetical protein
LQTRGPVVVQGFRGQGFRGPVVVQGSGVQGSSSGSGVAHGGQWGSRGGAGKGDKGLQSRGFCRQGSSCSEGVADMRQLS